MPNVTMNSTAAVPDIAQVPDQLRSEDGRRSLLHAEKRIDRIRERNRAAAARFRHKQKEKKLQLRASIQEKQQLLRARQGHLATLQSRNSRLQATHSSRQSNTCDGPKSSTSSRHSPHEVSNSSSQRPPARPVTHDAAPSPLPSASPSTPAPRPHHMHASATPGHATTFLQPPAPTAAIPRQPIGHIIPRHAASTLHRAPPTLPPPVSSFRATAGISYADLLEASGSTTHAVDFSDADMPELIRRVRAEKAARLGCAEGDICFFSQLHWQAAQGLDGVGLALSISASMSTPECVASSVLLYLVADLEILLRACRTGNIVSAATDSEPGCAANEHMHAAGFAAQGAAKRHSGDASSVAAAAEGAARPSAAAAAAASCPLCDGAGGPGLPSGPASGRRSECRQPSTCGTWSGLVTCGVNKTCCARCAARRIVRQVVLDAYGSERSDEMWRMCWRVLKEVTTMAESIQASDGGFDAADERSALVDGIDAAAAGILLVVRDVLQALLAGDLDLGGGCARSRACTSAAYRNHTFMSMVTFGLALGQAHRDAPRIIRTMSLCAARPLLKYFEVENMHVQLYRQLGLSAADKERMADVWLAWERRRRGLDKPHAAALALLQTLPGPGTLPDSLIRRVTACGGGPGASPQHAQHSNGVCDTRGASPLHACGDAVYAAAPHEHAHDAECRGLLGECAVATGVAQRAVRELAAVHRADADMYADTVDLQTQPGAVFSLDQICRQFCAHLMHEVAPADFMALCQLAATQRSRARAIHTLPFRPAPPARPHAQSIMQGAAHTGSQPMRQASGTAVHAGMLRAVCCAWE